MSKQFKPPAPGRIWVEGMEDTPAPTKQSKFALSEMAGDWKFFNHGSFFCHGGMTYPKFDPVADWFVQQDRGTEVLLQPFTRLLFEGLDSPIHVGKLTWGNVVLAVRHEDWPSLQGFLGGVAMVDHTEKLFSQTFTGDIQILDPVLVERYTAFKPDIPNITVTVFCTETNEDRWEVRPPINAAALPYFVRVPPRDDVVQMGKAVLSGEISELQHQHHPVIQHALDKLKGVPDLGHPDGTTDGS